MVPNIDVTTTEAEQILQQVCTRAPIPSGVPQPSIRQTPLGEASGADRIFAMAFPTLCLKGRADFNAPRSRAMSLDDYARHLLCFHDGRFGRLPRWRFFVFDLLMRRRATRSARFYVSKSFGLRDLDRDELAEALLADDTLLSQIVRQSSMLTGTRPYWRNKSGSLHVQARFLSPGTSPVFLTLSAADMQWRDLHRHFPGSSSAMGLNESAGRRFAWVGVQGHPHIIASYLAVRFEAFVKHVLRLFLRFNDHWCRFKWQARGSGHLHCLFWIPTTPPLDPDSDASRSAFASYWGARITA